MCLAEVSDHDVRELSFVGATCFAAGLVVDLLFAFEVGNRAWVAALCEADPVQGCVYGAVPVEVETVPARLSGALCLGARHGCDSRPLGERGFAREPVRVTDFDDEFGSGDGADTGDVGEGDTDLVEKTRDTPLQTTDASVDPVGLSQGLTEPVEPARDRSRDVELATVDLGEHPDATDRLRPVLPGRDP